MAEIKVMKAKDMKKVSSRQKVGKVLGLTATYLFFLVGADYWTRLVETREMLSEFI